MEAVAPVDCPVMCAYLVSPTLADLARSLMKTAGDLLYLPIVFPGVSDHAQMLPPVELEPEHIERIVSRLEESGNVQDIYPLAPLPKGFGFLMLAQ